MIIIMEPGTSEDNIQRVVKTLEKHEFKVVLNRGEVMTVIAAIGDKRLFDPHALGSLEGVREVKIIQEPYKLASREGQHYTATKLRTQGAFDAACKECGVEFVFTA